MVSLHLLKSILKQLMLKILALLWLSCVVLPVHAEKNTPLLQQLTRDNQATLSPDGKQVTFLRDEQLWLMNVSGDNARVIVQPQANEEPKQNLTELNNPAFSLTGDTIYFMAAAWATSNAIHAIDLTTNKQRYVTDGNSFEQITSGKYQGYLKVAKHKYYKSGGSYEQIWLVSTTGKPIKAISGASLH